MSRSGVRALPNSQRIASVSGEAVPPPVATGLPTAPSGPQKGGSLQAGGPAAEFERRVRLLTVLDSFRSLALSFQGLQGRKIVIWLSSGLSLDPLLRGDILYWRGTMDQLNASDIAVYGIDAAGLRMLDGFDSSISARGASGRGPIQFPHRPDEAFDIVRLMAEETAGKFFTNSNDLETAIDAARSDAGAGYELTFVPDRTDDRPRKHRLQIAVTRPHVSIRYRLAYWSVPEKRVESERPLADRILSIPFEAAGLPIAAKLDNEGQPTGRA